MAQPGWTDSHCHVHDEPDADDQLARAADAGVGRVVVVGTGAVSSQRALAFAGMHENAGTEVWATVGLHPHDASEGTDDVVALATAAAGNRAVRFVAVGECGLDYHYDNSPRDVQRVAFSRQIGLANELDVALVVHTRDAWDDTFAILAGEGAPPRTVVHCFSGGPAEARRALDLGCAISFSGIVTFKSADDVRAAASYCPLDRLLIETDAPYLAPVPYRGRPNEAAFVAVVGEAVAALRGVEPAELADVTSANAARLFGLVS
jgi:TatD DNase family protein